MTSKAKTTQGAAEPNENPISQSIKETTDVASKSVKSKPVPDEDFANDTSLDNGLSQKPDALSNKGAIMPDSELERMEPQSEKSKADSSQDLELGIDKQTTPVITQTDSSNLSQKIELQKTGQILEDKAIEEGKLEKNVVLMDGISSVLKVVSKEPLQEKSSLIIECAFIELCQAAKWTKNGKLLTTGPRVQKEVDKNVARVKIKDLSLKDSGEYVVTLGTFKSSLMLNVSGTQL